MEWSKLERRWDIVKDKVKGKAAQIFKKFKKNYRWRHPETPVQMDEFKMKLDKNRKIQ